MALPVEKEISPLYRSYSVSNRKIAKRSTPTGILMYSKLTEGGSSLHSEESCNPRSAFSWTQEQDPVPIVFSNYGSLFTTKRTSAVHAEKSTPCWVKEDENS
jgi:hypothetical protein